MKRLKISMLITLLSGLIFSQEINTVSNKTAYIIPANSREIGLFQPLKYGFNDKYEISTHPIAFFVSPNLQMKRYMTDWQGFYVSTQHTFYYPTPLLKMVAREGTGGIIAKEFKKDIPHMFSLYNGILLSKQINPKHVITLKAGLRFAINSGNLDDRTTIDLPLIYPRLQAFYEGFGMHYGVNVTANIFNHFYSDTQINFFHFPGSEENFAFEYSALYSWLKKSKFQLSGGYKLVYGNYPFGSQWHLLPMFDIKWRF